VFVANDSMREYLYHNVGNGKFEETGLLSGAAADNNGHTFAGMGVDFADYNNDGLADLIITDLAHERYALYDNNGDGTFAYSTLSSGIGAMTALHSGWGVRFLDYDNDGWKDLLITHGHDLDTIELSYPDLHYREPMLLARNTGHGFDDVSAASGDALCQPWVGRGMAIGDSQQLSSASDKRVHFGLGAEIEAQSIEIKWPIGIVQRIEHVRGNRILKINEAPPQAH